MPTKQKAILLIIFSMGGFVIVAAILTKIYCLVPSLISYVYMNWYFREASVAVYVTNLPTIWPLLRDLFPGLATWGTRSKVTGSDSRTWVNTENRSRIHGKDDYNMRPFKKGPHAESQERINDTDSAQSVDHTTIRVRREVSYTVESANKDTKAPAEPTNEGWAQERGKTTIHTMR